MRDFLRMPETGLQLMVRRKTGSYCTLYSSRTRLPTPANGAQVGLECLKGNGRHRCIG